MKIEDEPPDPLEWTPAYVARRELGLDEPADAFTDAIRAALPASKMRPKTSTAWNTGTTKTYADGTTKLTTPSG